MRELTTETCVVINCHSPGSSQVQSTLRRGLSKKHILALGSALSTVVANPTYAQSAPQAISPIRVEPDINGVNIVSGRVQLPIPVLSIPATARLKFDWIQNASPYVKRTLYGDPGSESDVAIQTGGLESETFHCIDTDCASSGIGTGSIYRPVVRRFVQAGTGTEYSFGKKSLDAYIGSNRQSLYYADQIKFPDGEILSFSYDEMTVAGDRTYYRPIRITSNTGFYIQITYLEANFDPESNFSGTPASAALYAADNPNAPLARLTYNGSTITDIAGRTYACTGCTNRLDDPLDTANGAMQLPTEGSASVQFSGTSVGWTSVVNSAVRDGVLWSYAYTNLRIAPCPGGGPVAAAFDRLTVTGPNGYNVAYDVNPAACGPASIKTITDPLQRMTQYEVDGMTRPLSVTFPEGNGIGVTYDQFANIVSKVTKSKPGSGLPNVTETAQFDINGCQGVLCYRPAWIRDGLGRQSDYLFNLAGQVVEATAPADANGVRRKTYIEYDTSTGLSRQAVVRICGVGTTCNTAGEFRTEYSYWNNTFLPSQERRIDGSSGQTLTTNYSYDAAGRLLSKDGPLPGNDDALYSRYDILGRRILEIGAKGITNGVREAKRFTYRNSDDNVVAVDTGYVTNPDDPFNVLSRGDTSYDAHRNPIRESRSSGGTTFSVIDTSYDDRGRPVCKTVRMNRAAFGSLPSDACTLSQEGGDGPDRITRNGYDAASQLWTIQKAYNTPLQQTYAAYTYTPNGKRGSVTDANGNLATMAYDGRDQQVRWSFPSAVATGQVSATDYESYDYDAIGNRKSLRKRDGRTIVYDHDGLNRQTSKTYPQGGARSVYYTYDLRGLQTAARFDGPGGGDAVTSGWDAFGRQTSSTTTMGGVSRTLNFAFEAGGARSRVTWPDSHYVSYHREATGKLYYADLDGSAPLFYPPYDVAGRVSTLYRWTNGSWGVPTGFGYDGIDRLTGLSHDLAATGFDVTTSFGYNPASQITARDRSNESYAFTGYVSANRSYAVNGLNQYTSAGPASFSYDANGNLTGDGTGSYGYDIENRLVSAPGGLQLTWDPLGRLYQTSGAASSTTQFLYDGDALVAEYDGAGSMTNRYVHSDGEDDPLVWYQGAGIGNPRYLYADHQGSIVTIGDAGGNPVAINSYDDYGITKNSVTGALAPYGRFGFTGQAWLPDLGMYHYKARIYSPTLGRFLQTDPIGYDDQVNLYAYVANDPVNNRDPSGMCPICVVPFVAPEIAAGISATITLVGAYIFGPPRPLEIRRQDNDRVPASDRQVGRNDNGGPRDPDTKVSAPGPLKRSSEVGDRVRTPDNDRDNFTRLKNGQGFSDNKTGTIMQRSNTNHSNSPSGEIKAGIRPGESPSPSSKVTISGGREGGCIIKKDGC